MIEVHHLTKKYKTKRSSGFLRYKTDINIAAKDINMIINKGQIVGLVGINGAGKTTTIKMLSTLLEADSGYGKIDGLDLKKDALKIKSKINMIVGGERMIYWQLTAKENLLYFGRLYNINKEELNDRILKLLKFVGLEQNIDQPVEQFSKGMKQRLQIARGLINNPDYLFLDEPTLGLDVNIAKTIRKKIIELARYENKGILLTSHYINEIAELCDYIYIIDKGKIIYEGNTDNIQKLAQKKPSQYTFIVDNFSKDLNEDLLKYNSDLKFTYSDNKIVISSATVNILSEILPIIISRVNILSFNKNDFTLEDAIISLLESCDRK